MYVSHDNSLVIENVTRSQLNDGCRKIMVYSQVLVFK